MAITIEEFAELIASKIKEKNKVTFDEYLTDAAGKKAERIDERDIKKFEWTDGEVVYMAPASIRHELLRGFLHFILKAFVQRHNLGMTLGPETVMNLKEQRRGRVPDILFIENSRLQLLKENYLDGAADLVIEVISQDSYGRDRGEKFIDYEAAGIREYWLLDPHRQQAEFYNWGVDGRYYTMSLEADGEFRSNIIEGFRLRVEWLWTLPNELDVLRELHVI